MPKEYEWESGGYQVGSGGGGGLGYSFSVLLSVVVGVCLFGGLFQGMKELKIWLGVIEPVEIKSKAFNLEQVEISSEALPEPEDEVIVPENTDSSELLAEVEELIPELDDTELDISPEISQPEVALAASIPLDAGEDFGELLEPVAAPEVNHVLDQVGRTENLFEEAATGQVMVEEGSVRADIVDPDEYLQDVSSQGSGGLSDDGLPSGYASIDGLLRMATGELSRSRAALPSDLLFEYDSAQLRETARLGLMKLAMLIDRNPEMFCVLEGHSDLFGNGDYNLNLSRQRAQAVEDWLVESMQLDGKRIVVRAFGNTQPKVLEGSIDEQAINRRVDILMRKELPEELPLIAPIVEKLPSKSSEPRAPVEKKPLKALRVEEDSDSPSQPESPQEPQAPKPREILRALPVD